MKSMMKNNKKKWISTLLALVLMFSFAPPLSVAYAGPIVADSSSGLYFNTATGTINFDVGHKPNIVIPSTINGVKVTAIANRAFYGDRSLVSISIPNSVTSIGSEAFHGCDSLTSVSIPESVTSIGVDTFSNCTALQSISLPNSITSISTDIFGKCSSLKNISIPNSVTSIGVNAFYKCSSLVSITIPNSVTSIANSAFSDCGSLTNISIPNSVTTIGNNEFDGDSSLVNISIPNSVTSIGIWAFKDCTSLKNVTLSNNLTSISKRMFDHCISIKSITIPNGVTIIDDNAFSNCTALTDVTIPDTVTTIGKEAFSYCTSLPNIPIFNSVTNISDRMFYNCTFTNVTIPNCVTSIGSNAFESCTSLDNINIPNSVASIGSKAFTKCPSLTNITIPSSVTSIGNFAFELCQSSLIVFGDDGSYAETYALHNHITFDDSSIPNHLVPHTVSYVFPVNHSNTINSILQKVKELGIEGFNENKRVNYSVVPGYANPYSAGALSQSDINDALSAVKMVRYLGGLPYDSTHFLNSLNNISQYGAVLLTSSGQFTHDPSKPDDMDQNFFNIGYSSCSNSNLELGAANPAKAVLGFMSDDGSNNIAYAGHRRWILQPGNQCFGIGFAQKNPAIVNMYVTNCPRYQSDSYVAWPNAGDFPIQYFEASDDISSSVQNQPWSIVLGAPYAVPNKNSVVLKLTRTRDKKTWIFDSNTPTLGIDYAPDSSMSLAVDADKGIIFRPDVTTLGQIKDGDVFQVELSGITYKDGTAASISYETHFFDLNKVLKQSSVTLHVIDNDESDLPDATVVINGQTLTTDEHGYVALELANNQTHNFTVSKPGYVQISDSIDVAESKLYKKVVVKAYVPVNDVALNKTSIALHPDDTNQLTATIHPDTASQAVQWQSSDTSVATVSSTGLVKAIGVGTAIITATTTDGEKVATCSVAVSLDQSFKTAVPMGLIATATDYQSIKLTFGAVSGATNYQIYRAISSSGTYNLISTITGTSFVDAGLATGTTYYYKISAYNEALNSKTEYSLIVSAKPFLSVPTKTNITKPTSGSVNFSWAAVTGASGYEVYYATSSAGSYTLVKSLTSTSLKITGLKSAKTYFYKVRAYRMVNNVKVFGCYSEVLNVYSKSAK